MAQSIMQTQRECFFCSNPNGLEIHHAVYGWANRSLSEKYGLKVYLCHYHHTGEHGVHFNKDLDLKLKQYAQKCMERDFGAGSFREVFGINYLEEK